MKKSVFAVLLFFTLFIGLAACAKKTADDKEFTKYQISVSFADNLDSAGVNETVTVLNDSSDPWDTLVFNLYPNAYRQDAPQRAYFSSPTRYGGIDIISVQSNGSELETNLKENLTVMTIKLLEPLQPKAKTAIDIKSVVNIPYCNLRLGFFEGVLNFGNFYPSLAVYENGAFREDNYCKVGDPFYNKASDFDVTVYCKKDLVLATSGDNVTETVNGDKKTVKISVSGARDFTVAASYDFKVLEGLCGDTSIKYYYTGNTAPENQLQAAMEAYNFFSSYIGAYSYKTFSLAETPFYYGGMEYQNLVLINKYAADKESIIVHETAHQWFGCSVGSDPINTAWLDEALVTYLSNYYYKETGNNEKFEALIRSDKESYNAFIKARRLTEPSFTAVAAQPIYNFSTNYEYTVIVYAKGSMMFDNIRMLCGDEKFKKALQLYYKDNKARIAAPDDLHAAFSRYKKDIGPILNAWLNDKILMITFKANY